MSCSWVSRRSRRSRSPLHWLHQAGRGLELTCCWVLALLALSGASGLANAQQTERGLLEFNSNKVLRASLMHRDHPESPLSVPGTTTEARFHAAVARENARMARRGLATTAAVEFNTSIGSAVPEGNLEYVMTLYLGTPVQKFVLIMDTGSDLLWVQCVPCIQCYNETSPFFDPSKSSTYSAVSCDSSNCNSTLLDDQAFCNSLHTCQIHYAYVQAGSEYEGVLSTETISFNNSTESPESVTNILFGCMNNNTDSLGHVDGIVGFGRGAFSLPNQLSRLNSVNVFSYCLVPYVVSTTLTSSLVFGVPDTSNELQLVYTPILNNNRFLYWVNMTGISINGVDVQISTTSLEYDSSSQSGGTVFDSGTITTIFSGDIWTVVTQRFKDLITYPIVPVSNVSICYNTSGVQHVAYPNMTLHFSGLDSTIVDFELTRQNLFIPIQDDVDCFTVINGASIVGINIIGNIAQADHYVETDLENMKVGWKSRNCSLPM